MAQSSWRIKFIIMIIKVVNWLQYIFWFVSQLVQNSDREEWCYLGGVLKEERYLSGLPHFGG